MKKVLSLVASLVFLSCVLYSQEARASIGLGSVRDKVGSTDSRDAATKLESYLSEALVKTKRFTIVSRSADDIDGLMSESMAQSGQLASLKDLDFLLMANVISLKKNVKKVSVLGLGGSEQETLAVGVEVRFLKASDGVILIQETIEDNFDGDKVTSTIFGDGATDTGDIIAKSMKVFANKLAVKITESVYPTLVLAVSQKGVVSLPNIGFELGEILNVYELGEPIIDPYTNRQIGREETLIAPVVVIEVSSSIVKAVVLTGKKYKEYQKATFAKGMLAKRTEEKKWTEKQIKPLLKQLK